MKGVKVFEEESEDRRSVGRRKRKEREVEQAEQVFIGTIWSVDSVPFNHWQLLSVLFATGR
jgi:hypothetical protein